MWQQGRWMVPRHSAEMNRGNWTLARSLEHSKRLWRRGLAPTPCHSPALTDARKERNLLLGWNEEENAWFMTNYICCGCVPYLITLLMFLSYSTSKQPIRFPARHTEKLGALTGPLPQMISLGRSEQNSCSLIGWPPTFKKVNFSQLFWGI